jgi:hypothetical protein
MPWRWTRRWDRTYKLATVMELTTRPMPKWWTDPYLRFFRGLKSWSCGERSFI